MFSEYWSILLSNTPQLVFLSLSLCLWDGSPRSILEPIVLPCLQVGGVNFCSKISLNSVISSHLLEKLGTSGRMNDQILGPIIYFVKGSIRSLRSFSTSHSLDVTSQSPTPPENFWIHSQYCVTINAFTEEIINNSVLPMQHIVHVGRGPPFAEQNVSARKFTQSWGLWIYWEIELWPVLPPDDNAIWDPLRLINLDIYLATHVPNGAVYSLSMMERGVMVNVCSQARSEDILRFSIKFYRDREAWLRRDWADDLDLSVTQDLI